ncbi:hypothetical protein CQA62_06045 [Helicobacter cholecystus]|uniref:Uncharacterized protein n=1 Tax=Helicobacter cholecystus TaxID=45498 RepID=A0A3D8IVQ0_9HELI|nr:hypothetical protein [Helicobacter cholecystus]RDU68661.1 hypothetical protein CQA62_06045 [Helicobacter cholecystus]VEJ24456.1 Uncharacterised protein [Helicobacter cholecystus]
MKYFVSFFIGAISIIVILFFTSLVLDPYGLKSTKNKRMENLTSEESFLYPLKIHSNAYYLIGTSRTLAFNIEQIEKNLNKKTYSLGISGSNIEQWLFLIKKIKEKKSSIILGIDLFSFNQTQIQENMKTQDLLDQTFSDFNLFKKYFYFLNANFIQTSFNTILRDLFLSKTHLFNTQNSNNIQTTFKIRTAPYQNFQLAKSYFAELIKYLDSKDIVIVFPEYWKYYLYYSQQQTLNHLSLLEEYIQIIKTLATQTKAQIWIFGGINPITMQEKNFDYDYWHFKPKVAELIIDKIFNQIPMMIDFGFRIDSENAEKQMQRWKEAILKYQE